MYLQLLHPLDLVQIHTAGSYSGLPIGRYFSQFLEHKNARILSQFFAFETASSIYEYAEQ